MAHGVAEVERTLPAVAAFARQLTRAYPERATRENQTALTMMVFKSSRRG